MGHHVSAQPPPLLPPAPKTEQPRWRPRTRVPGSDEATDLAEAASGDAVFATGGALDKKPNRRPKPASAAPSRAGAILQPLADETLRTLLIGQEGGGNDAG